MGFLDAPSPQGAAGPLPQYGEGLANLPEGGVTLTVERSFPTRVSPPGRSGSAGGGGGGVERGAAAALSVPTPPLIGGCHRRGWPFNSVVLDQLWSGGSRLLE